MNTTDFQHPRDSYANLIREFYAGIDGAAAAEDPRESQGDNWCCTSQTSRGEVLEKAGHSLLHIVDGKIYNSPGSIKFFETLAYPSNPRVPGFLFLMNLNQTEANGRLVVLITDILFQNGQVNEAAKELFANALKSVYDRHDRGFDDRYKSEPGRILAGIAGECGILDFFKEADADPFIDDLLHAALPAYREILEMLGDVVPTDEDFAAMHRHRARLVHWLTVDNIGIQFALQNGVPLRVIEEYGYPPVVRY